MIFKNDCAHHEKLLELENPLRDRFASIFSQRELNYERCQCPHCLAILLKCPRCQTLVELPEYCYYSLIDSETPVKTLLVEQIASGQYIANGDGIQKRYRAKTPIIPKQLCPTCQTNITELVLRDVKAVMRLFKRAQPVTQQLEAAEVLGILGIQWIKSPKIAQTLADGLRGDAAEEVKLICAKALQAIPGVPLLLYVDHPPRRFPNHSDSPLGTLCKVAFWDQRFGVVTTENVKYWATVALGTILRHCELDSELFYSLVLALMLRHKQDIPRISELCRNVLQQLMNNPVHLVYYIKQLLKLAVEKQPGACDVGLLCSLIHQHIHELFGNDQVFSEFQAYYFEGVGQHRLPAYHYAVYNILQDQTPYRVIREHERVLLYFRTLLALHLTSHEVVSEYASTLDEDIQHNWLRLSLPYLFQAITRLGYKRYPEEISRSLQHLARLQDHSGLPADIREAARKYLDDAQQRLYLPPTPPSSSKKALLKFSVGYNRTTHYLYVYFEHTCYSLHEFLSTPELMAVHHRFARSGAIDVSVYNIMALRDGDGNLLTEAFFRITSLAEVSAVVYEYARIVQGTILSLEEVNRLLLHETYFFFESTLPSDYVFFLSQPWEEEVITVFITPACYFKETGHCYDLLGDLPFLDERWEPQDSSEYRYYPSGVNGPAADAETIRNALRSMGMHEVVMKDKRLFTRKEWEHVRKKTERERIKNMLRDGASISVVMHNYKRWLKEEIESLLKKL